MKRFRVGQGSKSQSNFKAQFLQVATDGGNERSRGMWIPQEDEDQHQTQQRSSSSAAAGVKHAFFLSFMSHKTSWELYSRQTLHSVRGITQKAREVMGKFIRKVFWLSSSLNELAVSESDHSQYFFCLTLNFHFRWQNQNNQNKPSAFDRYRVKGAFFHRFKKLVKLLRLS